MNKILNLNNIAVEYLPGNSAYGQHGCTGLTGNLGNSMYYASYLCDDNMNLLKTQIKENKVFTNNDVLIEYNTIDYLEKDIIIDLGGNIYRIKALNKDKWYINDPVDPEIELIGSLFKGVETNDIPTATINLLIDTDSNQITLANSYYNSTSYCTKEIYIDRTAKNTGCVGIDFIFETITESTNNYNFVFYIQLPDGELLSIQKNTLDINDDGYMHAILYIDNRYIYTTLNAADSSTLRSYKGSSWYGKTNGTEGENEEDYIENIFKTTPGSESTHDTEIRKMIINYLKSSVIYYEIIDAKSGEIYKKYVTINNEY